MNFCSDNVSGAAPEIIEALARANEGEAMPYGDDAITARLQARFAEIFETEVAIFPVATGTAANALALAVMTPPFGAVYCHTESHINSDECGAPELFTGGAKLMAMDGADGKIAPADLDARLRQAGAGIVHHVQPASVSVTQASEAGTLYGLDELGAIAEICRRHALRLHMDGARFANAVAALDRAPADLSWRAGVDVLSFGATKGGALAAEAVVVFDPALAETLAFRRKRGGHLLSKMRFLSAQLEAYLADDLWLRLARHANDMASRLARGLEALAGVELIYPVEANEIFATMPPALIGALLGDGFRFYRWGEDDGNIVRLVTAFDTQATHVDAFLAAAEGHLNAAKKQSEGHLNAAKKQSEGHVAAAKKQSEGHVAATKNRRA